MVEILVVVALLSVIILGLVAMFSQTRKAFTSGLTQVDVLESGRSAADLIAHDMEQMTASGYVANLNFYQSLPATFNPMVQSLNTNDNRTNYMNEVYFITRNNQTWTAIGYKFLQQSSNGIGSLYRYSTTNLTKSNLNSLTNQLALFTNTFASTSSNYFTKLIDGVVHFRVRPYDTNGNVLFPPLKGSQNLGSGIYQFGYTNVTSGNIFWTKYNSNAAEVVYCQMQGGGIPASVDIELGVLEDRALSRYNGLTNGSDGPYSAAYNYLTNRAGAVHLFRQRIPIRNVNPAAFQ